MILFASFVMAEPCDSLEGLKWLLGEWTSHDGESVTVESWSAVSSQTMEGSGVTREKSTDKVVHSESLRLVSMSGGVYYLAKVGHNPLPVAFKLVECDESHAVFENDGHDFPRKLDYQFDGEKKLVVAVTGKDGKGFTLNFEKSVR